MIVDAPAPTTTANGLSSSRTSQAPITRLVPAANARSLFMPSVATYPARLGSTHRVASRSVSSRVSARQLQGTHGLRNSEEAGGSARDGRNRIWIDRDTRNRPASPHDRVLREAGLVAEDARQAARRLRRRPHTREVQSEPNGEAVCDVRVRAGDRGLLARSQPRLRAAEHRRAQLIALYAGQRG